MNKMKSQAYQRSPEKQKDRQAYSKAWDTFGIRASLCAAMLLAQLIALAPAPSQAAKPYTEPQLAPQLLLNSGNFRSIEAENLGVMPLTYAEQTQHLSPLFGNSFHQQTSGSNFWSQNIPLKLPSAYPDTLGLLHTGFVDIPDAGAPPTTSSSTSSKSESVLGDATDSARSDFPILQTVLGAAVAAILAMLALQEEPTTVQVFDTPACSENSEYIWGYCAIGADFANGNGATGSGVRVGVVDTGIATSHREFSGKTVNLRAYSSGGNTSGQDDQGHGTHVAGTIAAANDGKGTVGVAYDSELYSYKILNGGSGTSCSSNADCDASFAAAVRRQTTDGVQVSNNSWGTDGDVKSYKKSNFFDTVSPDSKDAYIAATNRGNESTIFVWAAGNSRLSNPGPQAAAPELIDNDELDKHWIVVVATDANKTEASFTNRCGVASGYCVAAPGVNIYSATYDDPNGYVPLGGTSMAAPHVTGAVAVLIQRFPSLSPAQIVTRLFEGASCDGLTDKDGHQNQNPEEKETCDSTLEPVFGHGLINLNTSLTSVFGHRIYATGGTWNGDGSVNVSESRIQLPAGLATALGHGFRSEKVAIFDSFDGATFWVSADEVFDFNALQPVPKIGYRPDESAHRSIHLGPMHVEDKGRIGLNLTVAHSDDHTQLGGSTQWTGRSAHLASAAFFTPQPMRQTGLSLTYQAPAIGSAFSLQPFVQQKFKGPSMSSRQMSLSGLGVNAQIVAASGTKVTMSVTQSEAGVNLSPVEDPNLEAKADLVTLDVGFSQNATQKVSIFGRAATTRLSSVAMTRGSWGLEDADLVSALAGVETLMGANSQFTLGIWQPSQFLSGTASYAKVLGRTQEGEVIWGRGETKLSESIAPAAYISFATSLSDRSRLTFTVQQSPWKPGRIGNAELRGLIRF